MRNEHAITYTEKISIKDLDYLVHKANKLGLIGNEIMCVYEKADREGTHVYYEVKPNRENLNATR